MSRRYEPYKRHPTDTDTLVPMGYSVKQMRDVNANCTRHILMELPDSSVKISLCRQGNYNLETGAGIISYQYRSRMSDIDCARCKNVYYKNLQGENND